MADRIVDMWELADRIEHTTSPITQDERVIAACALRWFAATKTQTGKGIGITPSALQPGELAVIPVPR